MTMTDADPSTPAEEAAGQPAPAAGAVGAQDEQRADAPPPEQLPALLEALLFVADGPVESGVLAKVLGVARRELDGPLEALGEALQGRGVRLQRGPEGVQLVTSPRASGYVERFLGLESAKRLSTAALETLAIVAYRQPVTRAQVEAIRGVNSDGAIDTLRTRGLVDITGRADSPGRPALFATTQRFLEHFGLERPEQLPPLPEEIAGAVAARLTEQAAQQLPLSPLHPTPQLRGEMPHTLPGEPERAPAAHEAESASPRAPVERGPHLPGMGVALPRSGAPGPPQPQGTPPPRGGGPPGSGMPRIG